MLEGGRSVDHVAGYVHRVESVLNRSSERFIDELGQTKAHARILIGLLADENDFPTDAPASGEHASGFQPFVGLVDRKEREAKLPCKAAQGGRSISIPKDAGLDEIHEL